MMRLLAKHPPLVDMFRVSDDNRGHSYCDTKSCGTFQAPGTSQSLIVLLGIPSSRSHRGSFQKGETEPTNQDINITFLQCRKKKKPSKWSGLAMLQVVVLGAVCSCSCTAITVWLKESPFSSIRWICRAELLRG